MFAPLLSAIIWNIGNWHPDLPASSSHTLVGLIVGVGLMNARLSGTPLFGESVNWEKAQDAVMALPSARWSASSLRGCAAGLPISTAHILSPCIAGTMTAKRSGLLTCRP